MKFALALVAALALLGTAHASMRRPPGALYFGPRAVFSDGTANPMFVPLGEGMASVGLVGIRVSTELNETSGNCKIRPAVRWSADGVTWGQSTSMVASYRSTVGPDYGSAYLDLTTFGTALPWVQFGVEVANANASSRVEVCNASLMIEPKGK